MKILAKLASLLKRKNPEKTDLFKFSFWLDIINSNPSEPSKTHRSEHYLEEFFEYTDDLDIKLFYNDKSKENGPDYISIIFTNYDHLPSWEVSISKKGHYSEQYDESGDSWLNHPDIKKIQNKLKLKEKIKGLS